MKITYWYKWLIKFFLIAMVGAITIACTSQPQKPVIKLVANFWDASVVNVYVAKTILEEEMGFNVEIIEADEIEQWNLLATGEAHASLELWESGHKTEIEQYIQTEKSVEFGGPLGVIGKIGWYIPAYLRYARPELVTWEGFKNPENATLFATQETGDKGRFLAGEPTWVQYDAQIIDNLNLNLQVVSVGTEEALLAELDAAYQKEAPILMYFWTPHWAHILYDLEPVQLPPYSDECYAKQAENGIDCDYPTENLSKIFWSDFDEYAPEAHQFLKNFNYTTRDQITMLASIQLEGKTPEQAAQLWIEQNKTVWQEWIP